MTGDAGLNPRLRAALQRSAGSASGLQASPSDDETPAPAAFAIPRIGAGETSVGDLLAAGFEALDLLNIGLIVCGASGQLLVANQAAQEILHAHDGLELDSEGLLSAPQDEQRSLREIVVQVAQAARTGEPGTLDKAFPVRRPSGKRPFTVFVRAVNAKAESQGAQAAAALVMILDSTLPVESKEAELRQLFGFTLTEAQLANLLMEGMALDDCCGELGIRRTTVRMHLRNIFAKTGARRQGELVSLLLKSIGLGPRMK